MDVSTVVGGEATVMVAEGSLWILPKNISTVGRRYQQGSWLLISLCRSENSESSILQMWTLLQIKWLLKRSCSDKEEYKGYSWVSLGVEWQLDFGTAWSLACGTGWVGRNVSVQCCVKPWPSVSAACSVLYELCRGNCGVWQKTEILMEELLFFWTGRLRTLGRSWDVLRT